MENFEFSNRDYCVNNNDELVFYLDEALERTAWIILTYHNIGNPRGFGWYAWDEFQKDVLAIKARDLWTAPMNDIVLYIRERENATIVLETFENSQRTEHVEITLSDGLDNDRFNQPLTILFDQPEAWIGSPFVVSQDGQPGGEFVFDTKAAMLSLLPNERPYILRLQAPHHG